jgi:hypothetical protein
MCEHVGPTSTGIYLAFQVQRKCGGNDGASPQNNTTFSPLESASTPHFHFSFFTSIPLRSLFTNYVFDGLETILSVFDALYEYGIVKYMQSPGADCTTLVPRKPRYDVNVLFEQFPTFTTWTHRAYCFRANKFVRRLKL